MKSLNASTSLYKKSFRFALCLLIFLVTACSQQPINQQWTQADWIIHGKIGFKQSIFKSGSLSFQWQQQRDNYLIHFFNPLGQLEVTLQGNGNQVIAEKSNGDILKADNAEKLMLQLSGWSLPLQELRQWFKGQASANAMQIQTQDSLVQSFLTPTWQVALSKYQQNGDHIVPFRIKMKNDNVQLTLIIKQHDPRFY